MTPPVEPHTPARPGRNAPWAASGPDLQNWLDRAAMILAGAVLVATVAIMLALPLLARRWVRLPFMGAFVEQTLIFNNIRSQQGARWSGIEAGLQYPYQLLAVDGRRVQSTRQLEDALARYQPGQVATLTYRDEDGIERPAEIELQSFPSGDLMAYSVIPYLIAITYLAIGGWVYRQRRQDAAGRLMALFCSGMAVVVGGLFDVYTTHVFTWAWTLGIGLAASSLFTLALVFPQETGLVARHPKLRWAGLLPGLALAGMAEFVVYDMRRPLAYVAAWRNEYLFASACILFFLGTMLYRAFRAPSPRAREQARVILWGSAVAFGPLLYYLLSTAAPTPPVFHVSIYFPPLVALPAALGYAILRYRVLNIDRLLVSLAVYAVISLLAGLAYTVLVVGMSLTAGRVVSVQNPLAIAIFILIAVAALNPLRAALHRRVDALYLRGEPIYRQRLQEFGRRLATAADLWEALHALQHQVEAAIRPTHAFAFLPQAATGDFAAHDWHGPGVDHPPFETEEVHARSDVRFPVGGSLAAALAMDRGVIYLPPNVPLPSRLAGDSQRLAALGSQVFVPFIGRGGLAGWLALGAKLSGEPYTMDDIEFLESLGNQAALAIERAHLLEQVRQRAAHLATLNEIGRAVSMVMRLEDVLEAIYRQVARSLPLDAFFVSLYHADTHTLSYPLVYDEGRRYAEPPTELSDTSHVSRIVRDARPLLINRLPEELAAQPAHPLGGASRSSASLMFAPLMIGSQVTGAISVQSYELNAYDDDHLALLVGVAQHAAVAIENARLYGAEQEQRRLAEALRDSVAAVNSTLEYNEVLDQILENAGRVVPHDAASIMLIADGAARIVRRRSRRAPDQADDLPQLSFVLDDMPSLREMKRTGRPLVIADTRRDARWVDFEATAWIRSYAGAPIRRRGEVLGFLNLNSAQPAYFTAAHAEQLLVFADQAGVAIDNAQLVSDLHFSHADLALAYLATLEGWSRALELRDIETEGHSQRVTEISLRLARALGIDDDALTHIYRGALMHDIGKMGIPDSVLLKPGPLTDEEWVIMRRHPQYAYELLSPIEYLRPALDIPYCHHEKWDGTGYPRGLKGEDIPLAARIFAVVDVWDALRSDRPYRPGWSAEKTREHIRSLAGTHFDARVVEAFLTLDL